MFELNAEVIRTPKDHRIGKYPQRGFESRSVGPECIYQLIHPILPIPIHGPFENLLNLPIQHLYLTLSPWGIWGSHVMED